MGHVMEDICVTGIRPEQAGVFGKSSSSSSSLAMTLIRKGAVMAVMVSKLRRGVQLPSYSALLHTDDICGTSRPERCGVTYDICVAVIRPE